MRKPAWGSSGLLFVISWLIGTQACATESADAFAAGVQAFKQGDYLQASKAFEKSRENGLHTPSLSYNLATTYYRLGRYPEAEKLFLELAAEPGWETLAEYNLALVARKQGQDDIAEQRFRQVQQADNAKLSALASRALESDAKAKPAHYLFASVYGGGDDNVKLRSDTAGGGGEDSQLTGLLTGRYYLGSHWSLDGLVYRRDLDDNDSFDTALAQLGVHRESGNSRWHRDHSLKVASQTLDNESYLDTATLESQLTRRLTANTRIQLSGQLQGIWAARDYDYLDGWQARAQLRWLQRLGKARWQLSYEVEFNDREDLVYRTYFASYSPRRQGVQTVLSLPFGARLSARARVLYQFSDYRDAYRTPTETRHRQDDLLTASLRTSLAFNRRWKGFVEYLYSDHHSSLERYRYDRQQWNLGIEYLNFYR